MKFLRSLVFPVVCFAAAWIGSYFITKNGQPSPLGEPPVPRHRSVSRKNSTPDVRKITAAQLTEEFQNRPTGEWAKLWEDFATRATVADLESIRPNRLIKEPYQRVRRDGRNVPYLLATEELATRANRPPAKEPGAYAALAEINPEAAWQNLKRNNLKTLSIGVMRTLAQRDPAGTLTRLHSIPWPINEFRDSDEDMIQSNSPSGAIFSAWIRRDPSGAMTAFEKLPQSERAEIAGQVAETWAYQDGPAALYFIVGFTKPGRTVNYDLRLERILRASFANHPAETAKFLAEHDTLPNVMNQRVLKLWEHASPEAAFAWVMEEENARKPGQKMDETTRWNSRGRMLFDAIKYDSIAVHRFIRALTPIDQDSAEIYLQSFHNLDPEASNALAMELRLPQPKDSASQTPSIYSDPEGACDSWLEELRRERDPGQALIALGWDKSTATRLAERATRLFPEKAAALAKLVPASSLDAAPAESEMARNLTQYWPDLEILPRPPPVPSSEISENEFRVDPATAAEKLVGQPLSARQVTQVIELWAPYDLPGCKAWLSRVPEGNARQSGELVLRTMQASSDPLGTLEFLTQNSFRAQSTERVWATCLHRLAETGGDWQGWLRRMPAMPPMSRYNVSEQELANEAKMVGLLRGMAR